MENLSPTENQIAFAETARRCSHDCAGKAPDVIARKLGQAGLIGALAREDTGGLGLSLRDAVPLVVEMALGGSLFPLVDSMMATALVADQGLDVARNILDGQDIATIAWGGELEASVRGDCHTLKGVATRVSGVRDAKWVVARVTGQSGEAGMAVFPGAATGLVMRQANNLDTDRHDDDLVLDDVEVGRDHIVWDSGKSRDRVNVAGPILRSAEMYGSAKACFEFARVHVGERRQFGRPLSAMQSVRHMLARDYYGLESVRYSLEYAALAADENSAEAVMAQDVLCGLAADICTRVAENSIQLHGAMGYTMEMPLHRHLRRILALSDIRPGRMARERLVAGLLERWQEAS